MATCEPHLSHWLARDHGQIPEPTVFPIQVSELICRQRAQQWLARSTLHQCQSQPLLGSSE